MGTDSVLALVQKPCNFYTTAVAYNTFIANPLIFSAVTFPVLGRPENEDAEPDEDMLEEDMNLDLDFDVTDDLEDVGDFILDDEF